MTNRDVSCCRLPVCDRTFANVDLQYWDGRLDNRRDLQAVLGVTPHGDATVAGLVTGVYEREGIDGLGRLIGDWSLVIRDPGRQAIMLASDYAGVRPLFYVCNRDRILWSPQLDALVEATGLDAIDEEYVGWFLAHGGHPTRTPYAGIACVPAGHAVVITPRGITTRSLWTMPVSDVVRYTDERRYDEQLRALFREAVAARLQSKAPVVAELSGGLDSSSVVCVASDLIRRGEVPATGLTTVSYVHEGSLDLPYILEVEAFCGTTGVRLPISRNPLMAEGAVGQGAPQAWAPLHTAAARTAQALGASTFLTGQGGDLAMGNWLDDSLQVARPLRTGQIGRAVKESLAWSKSLRLPMAWILWRALRASFPIGRAPEMLYGLDASGPTYSEDTSLRKSLADRAAVRDADHLWAAAWKEAPPERRKHFLALTTMLEMRTLQLLESVRDLDYTHPFAHRPLVEFVMSVPPDVLCQPGQPRRLMRRALGDLWPAKLRGRRSKSLFCGPWNDALRPLARALLNAPQLQVVTRGWIEPTSLISRLQRLMRGLSCNEPQLRQIILLEHWLRQRDCRGPQWRRAQIA